ncbi:MAG: sulfite exporter TauE/SafE family protein [Crocinitomicaceae bacterium]|nr:sulfite exporter TauE/SafE family protein [Crocinitomicaceae bacterium]MCF8433425.1 sulfite exporter TauE/SafE family protein [Crocinitomicaceae bacterium]
MHSFILYGFIIGLTANLHCIGMCGPIAMAIPVNRKNNLTILSGILQYNIGRILIYVQLGIIVGAIGITAETLGALQIMSIITGVFLIIYAWRKYIGKIFDSTFPMFGLNSFVSKNLGKVISSNLPFKNVFLGALNGLLPCGMVYVGLMNALIAGSPGQSALAMLAFGAGTLPAMIAVGFAANKINSTFRQRINVIIPYMLTAVGLLIVLRGMNLDIPYISPKVSTTITDQQTKKIEMTCCPSGVADDSHPENCEKK